MSAYTGYWVEAGTGAMSLLILSQEKTQTILVVRCALIGAIAAQMACILKRRRKLMALFRQCLLKEVNGDRTTVGWIEMRGAEAGSHAELKDMADVHFEVVEISDPSIEANPQTVAVLEK
jgi:hypothetical protein